MLEVGNVYSLKYDGGTNPGHTRTVLVVGDVGSNYEVMDFGLGGDFRHLTKTKVHTVKQLDAKVVDMSLLPSNVYVDDVVTGYEDDGLEVVVYKNTVYAVEIPECLQTKFDVEDMDCDYAVFNVGGDLWTIDDEAAITSNGNSKTLKDFVEALQKVVNA
jgi:hypothetical protein